MKNLEKKNFRNTIRITLFSQNIWSLITNIEVTRVCAEMCPQTDLRNRKLAMARRYKYGDGKGDINVKCERRGYKKRKVTLISEKHTQRKTRLSYRRDTSSSGEEERRIRDLVNFLEGKSYISAREKERCAARAATVSA